MAEGREEVKGAQRESRQEPLQAQSWLPKGDHILNPGTRSCHLHDKRDFADGIKLMWDGRLSWITWVGQWHHKERQEGQKQKKEM